VAGGPPAPDPLASVLPDQEAVVAAQARLIRSLSLRELSYEGGIPPAVVEAVLAQSELESFGLQFPRIRHRQLDLSFRTGVPHLQRVRLTDATRGDLAPLARVPTLKRLDLRLPDLPLAEVQNLLPGVMVTVQDGTAR